MKNGRIASIILSAGYSSRMGAFKPFLKFGGTTAVEFVVNTHKNAGIDDIIVVTGYRGYEAAVSLKDSGVQCIMNENYAEGMFSSVLKGVEALDENVTAFFIQPVDIPLVKKHTVGILKKKYLECNGGILYPVFRGKRGHPPLIDCKYKNVILKSDGEGGLKRVLESFSGDSVGISVFDEAVLMDMDTEEDYEKLLMHNDNGSPNMEECLSILEYYSVPDNIIRHCKEVAKVSLDIFSILKDTGCRIDKTALKAAALLHDIARKEQNHAQIGGQIIKDIGYEQVGSIIATHIDIEVDDNGKINENEILYLADKLVKEDRIVSLEERFKLSETKSSNDPQALLKMKNRFEAAAAIIKKIERATGKGFSYG